MSLPSSMADFVPCDRLLQKAYTPEEFENASLRENILKRKRRRHDNHRISPIELFSNTNPEQPAGDCGIFNFFGVEETKHDQPRSTNGNMFCHQAMFDRVLSPSISCMRLHVSCLEGGSCGYAKPT